MRSGSITLNQMQGGNIIMVANFYIYSDYTPGIFSICLLYYI